MADESHVKELLKGVESWNAWREANRDIKPDLQGIHLTLDAVRDTPLIKIDASTGQEFVDLSGVNFCDANLKGAGFILANLKNALFDNADLRKIKLNSANLQNAFLGGANLSSAGLIGADLDGANLMMANLQCANLWRANLSKVDFMNANLEYANVAEVAFDESSRQRKFKGIRVSTCFGSQAFKSFAQDQDYLEELRASGWWGRLAFWIWYYTSNCGRSFLWWAAWTILMQAFFILVYWSLGPKSFNLETGYNFDLITVAYHSVATFFSLGPGDIKPLTVGAKIAVMAEVVLGYFMLGVLIALAATKVARRA